MRRTTIFLSMLVLLFTLTLVACDQMFNTNLFAGLTQKKITSASVAAMTPAEIAALTASADAMKQLAADADAKAAALAALAAAYNTPAEQATAPGQEAAIAAADISIKTVPDAAQFAASAISLVTSVSFTSPDPAALSNALIGVLPADIAASVGSDPTPPAAFVAMIDAFIAASAAYDALGAGVGSAGYADPSIGSAQKMEIAVNAAIAGVLSTTIPASGTIAEALWSALSDPAGASGFLTFAPGISPNVTNLLSAAGLSL